MSMQVTEPFDRWKKKGEEWLEISPDKQLERIVFMTCECVKTSVCLGESGVPSWRRDSKEVKTLATS